MADHQEMILKNQLAIMEALLLLITNGGLRKQAGKLKERIGETNDKINPKWERDF